MVLIWPRFFFLSNRRRLAAAVGLVAQVLSVPSVLMTSPLALLVSWTDSCWPERLVVAPYLCDALLVVALSTAGGNQLRRNT